MEDTQIQIPRREYFSSGEVAKLCAVKRDSVVKWIRAGKLPASRTTGGHYRISRSFLIDFLHKRRSRLPLSPMGSDLTYCWEFHAKKGKIHGDCKKCICFKSRTLRCYELIKSGLTDGHRAVYCLGSCEECDYYKTVLARPAKIILITSRGEIAARMESEAINFNCDVKVAPTGYQCSTLLHSFKPDYIIIDGLQNNVNLKELTRDLASDVRLVSARLIIIGSPGSKIECSEVEHYRGPFSLDNISKITRM